MIDEAVSVNQRLVFEVFGDNDHMKMSVFSMGGALMGRVFVGVINDVQMNGIKLLA